MKNKLFIASALTLLLLGQVSVTSCSQETSSEVQNYVFELSGKGTINNVEYEFQLKGVEADKEFYIQTMNSDYEQIWGEWSFTEGKGYILTFDDAYWTEKKVKYDADKNQFYFTYEVNLGSAVGKTKVKFTGDATGFTYDNVGWGFEPFEWSEVGADVFGMTTCDVTVTCYEDLTFIAQGSCPLIAVPQRNGTYSYTEATNVYSFKFSDEETAIDSTYDADTTTYSLSLKMNVGMLYEFVVTYTPE